VSSGLTEPNPNSNPHAKHYPNHNPSSATGQLLRIERDDSATHGELTAAIVESE